MPLAPLRIVPAKPAAVKPFLRWAGGKSWFVQEYGDSLFDHVLEQRGRYIEPFLGGGAMALHLGLAQMVLGDIEEDIAITYTTIRDAPDELLTMLGLLQEFGTTSEAYYHVRGLEPITTIERAAKTLYLNKLCFNGLYRKNRMGVFNVPYGKKEKELHTAEQLHEVSEALRHAEIHWCDYEQLIERAVFGDVLYVDSPYDGTFSDYSSEGFGTDEQIRLSRALRRAKQRGVDIFAHNADTPTVRALYAGWDLIPMSERRAINADGEKRGDVPCVLIVSGDNH